MIEDIRAYKEASICAFMQAWTTPGISIPDQIELLDFSRKAHELVVKHSTPPVTKGGLPTMR